MEKFFYFFSAIVFAALSFFIFSPGEDTAIRDRRSLSFGEEELEPDDWGWMQRTFPYFNADAKVYINAIKQTKYLKEKQRALNKGKAIPRWEFAGPVNTGGRVVDIEFNPIDPNIVYAASATGGVFKSTDMGVSWFPVFDDQAVLTIGDIAIDPDNPDIIYVGTGEANGGHNNFPGGGVFKSNDAGKTWLFLGLENTASIGRIIINPVDTKIVYLSAVGSYFAPNPDRGIYKSTDGGETWKKSLFLSDSTGAIDIVMDPTNPSFLMAAMWERVRRPNSSHLYGSSSGIYRSTNGGENWQPLGEVNGLPNSSTENVGRIGLSICSSSPNIIYALYNDGNVYSGFYKTTDYGDHWINVDPDLEITNGASNFSWYFGQVRVHPINPEIVYAMDVGFMRSTNSGGNWTISFQTHVDHHALAFHPSNPDYIIDGNDGGINISTNGGVSWQAPAQLPNTQFYEIGLDYNNPQKLYGGTQDNNTIRTNTGNLDDWESILGGDGFYVIVDYTDPDIIYAEWQFGNLSKSTDGGRTFNYVRNGIDPNELTNWSTPVIMDPHNHNVLYYGTNRLYRTTDGAGEWEVISSDLTDGVPGTRLGTITTIAVAPSDSNVIYAGTDDSHIWVTTDFGSTWRDISGDPVLPYRWVTRVAVDPDDAGIVYVTFSGLKWKDPQPHVFKSTNYGESWRNISGNLPDAPVNAFAIDLNNSQTLYVGNDVGAFVSFNGGESWEILGEGLPVVSVYDLKIHPKGNYLAAGTHGRSMYKLDLSEFFVSVEDKKNSPNSFSLSQNYPNPFNPVTKIKYTIPALENPLLSKGSFGGEERGGSTNVLLKIFDILGKEVATLLNEEKSPGEYEIEFSAESGLSSGIYLYKLEAGKFSETKKMVLLR